MKEKAPSFVFHQLQQMVASCWQWDTKNYPIFAQTTFPGIKMAFAAPHVLLHSMGVLGRLAKLVEPTGHGPPFTETDRAVAEEAIAKLFVNGLMLASLLGIEAGKIPDVMRRIMEEQASKKVNEERAAQGVFG